MSQSRVLVLHGDGINCERETARAFEQEGAKVNLLHVNDFLKQPKVLLDHSVLAIPGGFSFGDELRSGKILAEKLRATFTDIFQTFLQQNGMAIGICNGFQVLIQLGVFEPQPKRQTQMASRTVTLATNDHGQFLDFWTTVEITHEAAQSPWFFGMQGTMMLPIRHKEGRIVVKNPDVELSIPLKYSVPVNGSHERAAALLDWSGQILGLMPHPEAANQIFLNPSGSLTTGISAEENVTLVRRLFQNAVRGKQA